MKLLKRFGAVFLAFCMSFSLFSINAEALSVPEKVEHRFTDVNASDWYCPHIQQAYDLGLMSGTSSTTFDPKGASTRSSFVQTLYSLVGRPAVSGTTPFKDLTADWYKNAILWAYQNQITSGTSATTFSPNANVTREQIAVFLYSYSGKPQISGAAAALSGFTDSAKTDTWAKDAVVWAVQNNIISGVLNSNGTRSLNPLGNASRAEAATMMVKFYQMVYGTIPAPSVSGFDYSKIPEYTGSPYVAVNNNIPYFTASDMTTASFETYSTLDSLGRCDTAYANVGIDLMPTTARTDISSIKPTGWHSITYDIVEGKYLYNRCHLIGYQLTAENANKENLITGTRYLNVDGMLPFENMVADYIQETNHHVLYRVTPVFEGDNLLAHGVLMEAKSVEDNGEGIEFCVYCYNVQPGIAITYSDGSSRQTSSTPSSTDTPGDTTVTPTNPDTGTTTDVTGTYILNTNTKKFHLPTCSSASKISSANKASYTGKRSDLIAQGYDPCKICNP